MGDRSSSMPEIKSKRAVATHQKEKESAAAANQSRNQPILTKSLEISATQKEPNIDKIQPNLISFSKLISPMVSGREMAKESVL